MREEQLNLNFYPHAANKIYGLKGPDDTIRYLSEVLQWSELYSQG